MTRCFCEDNLGGTCKDSLEKVQDLLGSVKLLGDVIGPHAHMHGCLLE